MSKIIEIIKKTKGKRKYRVIAKVTTDTGNNFVKYRTNNVINCINFLQKKYKIVFFANIFHAQGFNQGKLYLTWGYKKGFENPI